MCTQSHESVFQKVRGHSLVWRRFSLTGRGDSLCSNSLYHCNKGPFTHEPLREVAIKLPTVSSRYGWLFIIFYCLVEHVIQGQNADNMSWMQSNAMDENVWFNQHFRGWKTRHIWAKIHICCINCGLSNVPVLYTWMSNGCWEMLWWTPARSLF